MANTKKGFIFFRADTDKYQDIKIKRLKRKHGCEGLVVFDYVLCEIFRVEGYFIEWNDDVLFDISEIFALEESVVSEIIHFCCEVGLFDEGMFEMGVLTSKSIQKRYIEMSNQARRSINSKCSFWLQTSEESGQNAEESGQTSEKTPRNSEEKKGIKVEKSKVKNSKVNISLSDETPEEDSEREKFLIYSIFFFRNFKNPHKEVTRFFEHYETTNWRRKGDTKPVSSKTALAKTWREPPDARAQPYRFTSDFLKKWKIIFDEMCKLNESAALAFVWNLGGVIEQNDSVTGIKTLTFKCSAILHDSFISYWEGGLKLLIARVFGSKTQVQTINAEKK